MKVSAEVLYALAQASGAPTELRAEQVVKWATDKLKERPGGVVVPRRADWQVEDGSQFWRPSIFMPRWASRITLEVTGVRVERLQDISEADAIAEGLESYDDDGVRYWGTLNEGHFDPRQAYFSLWDTINEERAPAKSNPWVWVVAFKRVDSAAAPAAAAP